MKRYFNKMTLIYLFASIALAFGYSFISGYSAYKLINALTFLTALHAFMTIAVYSRSKGDSATMTYNKTGATVDYDSQRSYVAKQTKEKNNPFLGTFIVLLLILIAVHQFNIV